MKACVNCEGSGDDCFDPTKNPALKREIKAARKAQVPDNYIKRVIQFARQGYTDIDFPTYDTDWDSEAYLTVSGQNSNNSVRVTDDFLQRGRDRRRLGPDPPHRRQGRQDASRRATCGRRSATPPGPRADPGIQFHTTINDWHTCPAVGADPRLEPVLGIHVPRRHGLQSRLAEPAAVPRRRTAASTSTAYEHAVRLWTVVLEISVTDGAVPVARRSPSSPTTTARSASATPISAAC